MKKILYYIDSNEYGGAEITLVKLIQKLDRTKYEPVLVLQKSSHSQKILSQIGGIKFYELSRIRIWLNIFNIFKQEMPDILHLNMHVPFSCFWAIVCAKLVKIPFIISTIHSSVLPVSRFFLFKWIKIILTKALLPKIDRFICVSYASKDEFCKNYIILPSKVDVVYNWIDKNEIVIYSKGDIDLLRKQFGIAKEIFVIGILTRLVKDKGLEVLIKTK